MRIIGRLRDACPSGIDCDRIYDTDGSDLVIQGRVGQSRIVADPGTVVPEIPLPPPGWAVVFIASRLLPGVAPAETGFDRVLGHHGDDLVVQGRAVSDPTALAALGISAPPSGEAIVLVDRAVLPGLVATVAG